MVASSLFAAAAALTLVSVSQAKVTIPMARMKGFSNADRVAIANGRAAAFAASTTGGAGGGIGNEILVNELATMGLYTAEVTIGNGQTVLLDLDTGSSDLWVRGSTCVAPANDTSCVGISIDITDATIKPVYVGENEGNRTTPLVFYDAYGLGTVNASIYSAPVEMAGLKVANYQFGIAYAESQMSSGNTTIGLLGLAGPMLSSIWVEAYLNKANNTDHFAAKATWFDGLNLTGDEKKFGFYLSEFNGLDNGELTLGGVDETKFTGPITYLPINQTAGIPAHYWKDSGYSVAQGLGTEALPSGVFPWWQFNLAGATSRMSNQKLSDAVLMSNPAMNLTTGIADTGTTLLIASDGTFAGINASLTAFTGSPLTVNATSGFVNVNCNVTLPDLILNFAGVDFTIPGEYLNLPLGDTTCGLSVQGGADASVGTVILGDIFLSQYYSIYDYSSPAPRVGFALAVHSPASTNTTVPPTPTSTGASATVKSTSSRTATSYIGSVTLSASSYTSAHTHTYSTYAGPSAATTSASAYSPSSPAATAVPSGKIYSGAAVSSSISFAGLIASVVVMML